MSFWLLLFLCPYVFVFARTWGCGQAMLGTNAMLRSTDLSASSEQHTPAMRQFGVRDSDDGQFSGYEWFLDSA
jgi:hypothetical protein